MSLFAELKRRNVFRVAIAYVAVSWLLIQVAETVFPVYGLSDAAIRFVITAVAIGFIPVLVVSWVFELTPSGLKRDSEVDHSDAAALADGKKFNRVVLVVLAIALGYFAFDKFVLDPARDVEMVEEATEKAITRARVESFGEKSIAVLPFVNMSSDPEQAFFSDGIAEELLNLLTKIPQLRVTSRSSAFEFRGDSINIPEVAEKLNVAHVLEGSVRKAGNQVRITVQLIEAKTDTHLWSETYDRPLDDIFAIQDEVAANVVEHLQVTLLGETPKAKPVNVLAYPLYLQARQIVGLLNLEELSTAEELLNQALEIDPTYVEALNELGKVYGYQLTWMRPSTEEAAKLVQRLENNLAKTQALDPDNAGLKTFMAYDADNQVTAARLFEEALETDPSRLDTLRLAAQFSTELGRTDLAIRIYEYLAERDPIRLWVHFGAGDTYLAAGRFEDALHHLQTAVSLNPNAESVHWRLGLGRLVAGDPEGALEAFERETHKAYGLQGMSMALHDLGHEDESASVLQELIDLQNDNFADIMAENPDIVPWPFGFARAYAWIGNKEEAFRFLKITAEQQGHIPGLANHSLFTRIHDDSRWLPFLHSIGEAPEQLAEIEFNPRLPYEVSAKN